MAKKFQDESDRWKVSQAEFCRITGMQHKQIYDWEDRYQIPCGRGREEIFFQDVFTAIRKIFADNKMVIGNEEAAMTAQAKRKKLELELERIEQQTKKLRSENLLKDKELIPRERILEHHNRMVTLLRNLGDSVARKKSLKGSDVQAMINATLQNYQNEINGLEQL